MDIKKVFKSLSGRILLAVFSAIFITLLVSLFVQRQGIHDRTLHSTESEFRDILVGAESMTDSLSDLGALGAFDSEALLAELHEKGVENFRDTTLYQTIPVVAAWNAIERVTEGKEIQFRIARNNPRNPENAPKTELERRLLAEVSQPGATDVFIEDKASGLVSYARPIVMSESCMGCHGDPANSPSGDGLDIVGYKMENWRAGDRQGAYILSAPMTVVTEPIKAAMMQSISWAAGVGLIICLTAGAFVRKINRQLGAMVNDLDSGSRDVDAAANEIANSSQALAEGASEQAASLEETSASMAEMKRTVERNSELANETQAITEATSNSTREGVQSMNTLRARVDTVSTTAGEMNLAMKEIQDSSNSISKIIKTIDEIAFQTNILALNAAVEAARAGEAGAGFAVVADEVRSLAHRASEAAGETTTIIETSIQKTIRGVKLNEEVTQHLKDVLEHAETVEAGLTGINSDVDKVRNAMNELNSLTGEQSEGISQINEALEQVNEVTQSNAATAEESASASEEMSAQTRLLQEVVSTLSTLVSGSSERPGQSKSHALTLHDRRD